MLLRLVWPYNSIDMIRKPAIRTTQKDGRVSYNSSDMIHRYGNRYSVVRLILPILTILLIWFLNSSWGCEEEGESTYNSIDMIHMDEGMCRR